MAHKEKVLEKTLGNNQLYNDKQTIGKLDSPLLTRLIKTYYENEEENDNAIIEVNNRDLRYLILLVKQDLAKEIILDYELFERRNEKINFINENKES